MPLPLRQARSGSGGRARKRARARTSDSCHWTDYPGGRATPARSFGIRAPGADPSRQRLLTSNRASRGGGRRDFRIRCNRCAFPVVDDAARADVVRRAETLRPHRRASANEIVQRRNEHGKTRTGGGIALETAENEVVEARRYGAP